MGVLIHIPEKDLSVVFPGSYESISDFSNKGNGVFSKIASGYMELVMMLAYQQMVNAEEFTIEEISMHIEEFYPGMDMESTLEKSQEIEKRLDEILNSEDFMEKHKMFYPIILKNVFTIFASGAVANEVGDTHVISTPVEFRPNFSAIA